MPWTDYTSAPMPGTQVCPAAEVGTVLSVKLASARGVFPLILVRAGETLRAYVNACPHQYLPLDYQGDRILTADGTRLMCTAHGAMFDAASGDALLVAPCGLDPVPVEIKDGIVVIAAPD